jgi:uncharacterized protein
MKLSLDTMTLGVPEAATAQAFYDSTFSPPADRDDRARGLDSHGTGRLALHSIDALAAKAGTGPATSGFRGLVLSYIVEGPGEAKVLLDAATGNGATVVKPAKKRLFGELTAAFRAPDGTVWKLAAAAKQDPGPVPDPPKPTETAIYLGVARPKASKDFYEALGMSTRHDYGDKFIDFDITAGASRLGLLPRKALAKDVGIDDEHGEGSPAAVLTHHAASRDDVDALLAAADASGGHVTAAAATNDTGDYTGHFTDLDGYHWNAATRA